MHLISRNEILVSSLKLLSLIFLNWIFSTPFYEISMVTILQNRSPSNQHNQLYLITRVLDTPHVRFLQIVSHPRQDQSPSYQPRCISPICPFQLCNLTIRSPAKANKTHPRDIEEGLKASKKNHQSRRSVEVLNSFFPGRLVSLSAQRKSRENERQR